MEKEISVPLEVHLKGPFSGFTAMQDLEKDQIRVFGFSASGYFSYVIFAKGGMHHLFLERCPKEGIVFGEKQLFAKEILSFPDPDEPLQTKPLERLSFGNHKKQDLELIFRRLDLSEIIPIVFMLGQKFPKKGNAAMPSLFESLERCIKEKNRLDVEKALLNLCLAGFNNTFVPRNIDTDYQGFPLQKQGSSLGLLTHLQSLVRSLFVQEAEKISILPCLPVSLHAGRFKNVQMKDFVMDLEWSKKKIKRISLRAFQDGIAPFDFGKNVEKFRINRNQVVLASAPFAFKKGHSYTLDRFH